MIFSLDNIFLTNVGIMQLLDCLKDVPDKEVVVLSAIKCGHGFGTSEKNNHVSAYIRKGKTFLENNSFAYIEKHEHLGMFDTLHFCDEKFCLAFTEKLEQRYAQRFVGTRGAKAIFYTSEVAHDLVLLKLIS